ncbi:MAG: alpha-L-fucosidase [Oscillospiraceae bacterium]|nr:alpha-L-fucosidase [Oscillospiraceae bacterium]
MKILSRPDYEKELARTRDRRMKWWREARFGMFVHYGLYAQARRHEWLQVQENVPPEEYEALAKTFAPKPGCCREWAALAKKAGMRYMVLTTRHHDGFSLWQSEVNPYNAYNACGRDVVREFVEACREFGLKIGFYSSLMDWHHPDGGRAAWDTAARRRFLDYTEALNTELLTNYGKIDILWYDGASPMTTWEGWDSLERNQRLRALQPDIIINNRSGLDEDFSTPEGELAAAGRDWEACMTFNGISWGYVDSAQARPYSCSAQQILQMLSTCAGGGGNLLLNIGPAPDGSVPEEAVEPLTTVGRWLEANGDAVYGRLLRNGSGLNGNAVCRLSRDARFVYLWNLIWPTEGEMGLGGWMEAPKSVSLMDGTPVAFEHRGHRILLSGLPAEAPDKIAGITVIRLEYDHTPAYCYGSYYPQIHHGADPAGENKL